MTAGVTLPVAPRRGCAPARRGPAATPERQSRERGLRPPPDRVHAWSAPISSSARPSGARHRIAGRRAGVERGPARPDRHRAPTRGSKLAATARSGHLVAGDVRQVGDDQVAPAAPALARRRTGRRARSRSSRQRRARRRSRRRRASASARDVAGAQPERAAVAPPRRAPHRWRARWRRCRCRRPRRGTVVAPVPRAAASARRRTRSTARSTSSSVSGRGMSARGSTPKARPWNSLTPRM